MCSGKESRPVSGPKEAQSTRGRLPPAAARTLPPAAPTWRPVLAAVFTWKQEHVLPGATAVPAVHTARHAARLRPWPERGA